jgi:UDP-glucuronate 4-epimerase
MRALVTGAAGFVGSHLAERLCAEGYSVRAVDCLTPYYDVSLKRRTLRALEASSDCQVVVADLRSADLAELVDDVDVVFHQAGQPGVRTSWDEFETYMQHNVFATQRLLDAVRGRGVRRFVYASSSSVYGDSPTYPTEEDQIPRPVSPYGVTKLAAEQLCSVYAGRGVPVVSLRYFTVFGPRQRPDMAMHRLIEAALSGDPFPLFGDGRQVRDFTYVDDVVEANLRAVSAEVSPGSVVNIAGGTAASLLDVVGIVERLVGRRITLHQRPSAPGDVFRTGGSTGRAHRLLGWRPQVQLTDGLAAQVAWHALQNATARSA